MKNPWIAKRNIKEMYQQPITITVDWGSVPVIDLHFVISYTPVTDSIQYTAVQQMQNEEDARFFQVIEDTIQFHDHALTSTEVAAMRA